MLCAGRPGSDRSAAQEEKASLHWVPSRCMLADGLTKPGLTKQMRETLSSAVCKLQAGWIYSMHIKSWNTAAMEHYRVIY